MTVRTKDISPTRQMSENMMMSMAMKEASRFFKNDRFLQFRAMKIAWKAMAPSIISTFIRPIRRKRIQLDRREKPSVPLITNVRLRAQSRIIKILLANISKQSFELWFSYFEFLLQTQSFKQYQQNSWPQVQVMWQQPLILSMGISHLGQLLVRKVMQMKLIKGLRLSPEL